MTVTLDIAAAVAAFVWPIIILVILLVYRKKIFDFVAAISGRISKLSIGGFSLELAQAKAYSPEWRPPGVALDIRHAARSIDINDSTARNFITQLEDTTDADYALIDLGTGKDWLSSRLYILCILLTKTKGLKAFVFVEQTPSIRKKFLGWAEPARIRWSFARCFPWLERAYADAYSQVVNMLDNNKSFNVSTSGRLATLQEPSSPAPSFDLLKEFLQRVQIQPPIVPLPEEKDEWVSIVSAPAAYEHAIWLDAPGIEEILGEDLHISHVRLIHLLAKKEVDQIKLLARHSERFIALTKEDQRFDRLIDRSKIIDEVIQSVIRES